MLQYAVAWSRWVRGNPTLERSLDTPESSAGLSQTDNKAALIQALVVSRNVRSQKAKPIGRCAIDPSGSEGRGSRAAFA
jgi:hypothetical protein